VDTKEERTFYNPTSVPEEKEKFNDFCRNVDKFILHNGIGFDVPVIRILLDSPIDNDQVVDTLVISRFKDYLIDRSVPHTSSLYPYRHKHSLEAWGERLGYKKTSFKAFDKLSPELVDYCTQDVRVTYRLYKKLLPTLRDKTQAQALEVEHNIQWLCERMTDNGFCFREDEAEEILGDVVDRKESLEAEMQRAFPPKLQQVHQVTHRIAKDGREFVSVTKNKQRYPIHTVKDGMLLCYDYVSFNPASPKMRIDRMWEAGWEPVDKTKGHIEYERTTRPF
jgi:DNA polymerase I-like protein with 3'-5' exonuclease and polymerase domains